MSVTDDFNLNFNKKIGKKIVLADASAHLITNELRTLSGREKIRIRGQSFCISCILGRVNFRSSSPIFFSS